MCFIILNIDNEVGEKLMPYKNKLNEKKKKKIIAVLMATMLIMAIVCILVGVSNMSLSESFAALFGKGTIANIRIMKNIRLPRVVAAIIAGAGLAVAGLIMQTTLGNMMASPSTLGVSNAAVFGANLSIIVFAGGFLSTGNNLSGYTSGMNPYATSLMAFVFCMVSVAMILVLCKRKAFSPNVVILSGIAIGSVWTAATTVLQFYATDVGLSAAVIWNFGDLGRATYKVDIIMATVVFGGILFFILMSWKYNALLAGDSMAKSMGVNVDKLRSISLMIASLITAVCVSFLGIIGFVGIICPHIVKRMIGQDHRYSIVSTALVGSILLLLADTLSRSIGKGSALPVGAITSLLGAPFFVAVIFSRGEAHHD